MESARYPNLFVVGAAKAGTTALHSLLGKHPDICMSRVKEPHYFADVRPDPDMRHLVRRTPKLEDYLRLFDNPASPIRGEASPSYLFDERSAARISAARPDAKIIILLRDPVERAFSHYLMDVREGRQTRSFEDALAHDRALPDRRWATACHLYEDLGRYADQIARYLDVFDRDQILVLEARQFATDQQAVAVALGGFLGLAPEPLMETLDDRESNHFARPKSRAAAAIIANSLGRRGAQRLLPRRTRHAVRDRLLMSSDHRPSMQSDTRVMLQESFTDQVTRTRNLLAMALPSLTSNWLSEETT